MNKLGLRAVFTAFSALVFSALVFWTELSQLSIGLNTFQAERPDVLPLTSSVHIAKASAPATQAVIAGVDEEPQTAPEEWIIPDIALDIDTQRLLKQACDEADVDFRLALSVIWTETRYQNINGDNGSSIGYMQIQPRWHYDRMARLGVTDLSDPLSNFRVGCDLLAELLSKYPLEEALTAYNRGSPGKSEYAATVLAYMAALQEV